jgi:hypothetical protein
MVNFTDTIANIVMLTVLECDLGIIAGSMPMLRSLLRVVSPSLSASNGRTPDRSRDVNLMTIGGSTGRRTHMKLSNVGDTKNDDRDYHFQDREGSDNESSRRIIHVTHKIEQDSVSDRGGLDDHYQVVVTSSDGQGVNFGGENARYH